MSQALITCLDMPGPAAYSGTVNQADGCLVVIPKYYSCQKYFRFNFLPPSPQPTLKVKIYLRPFYTLFELYKGVHFLVENFLRVQVLCSIH